MVCDFFSNCDCDSVTVEVNVLPPESGGFYIT